MSAQFFLESKNTSKNHSPDIYMFKGTEKEKIQFLRKIRDEIGDWVQDFHYFMSGEANTLIADCCELLSSDDSCCDLERNDSSCCNIRENNSNCCSFDPSDSTPNKDSS